jgi:excisionase family DNA binding protein
MLHVIFGAMDTPLQRLRKALKEHRNALQELEEALAEYGETLPRDEASEHPPDNNGHGLQLLSIADVCKALGMGKSWTYRRIRGGEIPSVKLGRSIKVKREDLEQYLEGRRYHPPQVEQE